MNINYYLMNKDDKIVDFIYNTTMQEFTIKKQEIELPVWFGDISTFIDNRKAPPSRENIKEAMIAANCYNMEDYIRLTYAVSLNDTLWVKQVGDTVNWRDVSMYTNPFNELLAQIAFNGIKVHNVKGSRTPEFSTHGSYAKCWLRNDNGIFMLKKGTGKKGKEPFSEFYASQIVRRLTTDYVPYTIHKDSEGRPYTSCRCFCTERYGYIPYAGLGQLANRPRSICSGGRQYNAEKAFLDMFVIDAVILNEDRHMGNFGFSLDNDTLQLSKAANLFDHNLSLLATLPAKLLTEDVSKCVERNFITPRFGDNFIKTAAVCARPSMIHKLETLRGFKFTKDSRYNLSDERLDYLERLVNYNITQILDTVTILKREDPDVLPQE